MSDVRLGRPHLRSETVDYLPPEAVGRPPVPCSSVLAQTALDPARTLGRGRRLKSGLRCNLLLHGRRRCVDSGPLLPSPRSSRPLSGFGGGSLVRSRISVRRHCLAPGRTSNRLAGVRGKRTRSSGTDTIGQEASRNSRVSARIPPKMAMRCRSSIRASCMAHSSSLLECDLPRISLARWCRSPYSRVAAPRRLRVISSQERCAALVSCSGPDSRQTTGPYRAADDLRCAWKRNPVRSGFDKPRG